jgi:hypothetical protein
MKTQKIPPRIQIAAVIMLQKPDKGWKSGDNPEIDSLAEDFAADDLNVDDILVKKGSRKVEFLVSWSLPSSFNGFKIVNLEAMKGSK